MRMLKHIMSFSGLRMLYIAYLQCSLIYGTNFWGNSPYNVKLFRIQKRDALSVGWAICISTCLTSLMQQQRNITSTCLKNVLWFCKQITILIFHQVIPRLVATLNSFIPLYVSDVVVRTVHCKLINFVFKIFPLFTPETSAGFMTYIVQIIPVGSCNHCNLACFLWSTNFKHASSNHGLCFFNSWT
jgi:hypothetical protein